MKLCKKFCIPFLFLSIFAITKLWGVDVYVFDVSWNPTKDFLAAGGQSGLTYGPIAVYLFNRDTNALTLTDSRSYGTYVNAIPWSPDGKYLAAGGGAPTSGNELQIYRFFDDNRLSGRVIVSKDYGGSIAAMDWNPTSTTASNYCIAVVGGNPTISVNEIIIYAFNVTLNSLTITSSREWANPSQLMLAVKFDSTGNYLAVGGMTPNNMYELQIYNFDKTNGKILGGSPVAMADWGVAGQRVYGIDWSPDGKYLSACGEQGSGYNLRVYKFLQDTSYSSQQRLLLMDGKYLGTTARSAKWSSIGNYIVCGVETPVAALPYEMQVYSFDTRTEKLSDGPLAKFDDASGYIWAASWTPDARYLACGEAIGGSVLTFWSYYKQLGLYRYDGSMYNIYQDNDVILKNGDNARGSVAFKQGLTITPGSGVKLNIDAPVCVYLDLRTTGSMILDGDLFLDSNLSLSSGGILDLNGYALFLNGNLQVPANSVLEFASDGVFDGQGFDLILGKYSQLLVDGGVTVTFKNMTIKNTLNTISCPPIRCMDWYSQACFDNVTFAFNDDFAFRNGQFFIYNDVEFTGTSKFSYRSVRPSYIAQHANFTFDPQTTFEFYPSSTDSKLIQMQDKTASIIFDESTLQTTHTGIQLTKGSLYFDNKVTLSSADITAFAAIMDLGIGSSASFGTTAFRTRWSPDGKFLAVAGSGSNPSLRVYTWTNEVLRTIAAQTLSGADIRALAWSPDGRFLAIGGAFADANDVKIYGWDGLQLTLKTSLDYSSYTFSVEWSPDGKFFAIAGLKASRTNNLSIYRWNGASLSLIYETSGFSGDAIWLNWHPSGRFLAVTGAGGAEDLQVYSWNGSALTKLFYINFVSEGRSVNWSPDGRFLAVSADNSGFDFIIYEWTGNSLVQKYSSNASTFIRSVRWSCCGKFISVVGFFGAILYEWNYPTASIKATLSFASGAWGTDWRPDKKYLAVVGGNGSNDVIVYRFESKFDTSPQSFSNGIIFGNSAIGSTQDLEVNVLGGANIGIAGKVWYDDIN